MYNLTQSQTNKIIFWLLEHNFDWEETEENEEGTKELQFVLDLYKDNDSKHIFVYFDVPSFENNNIEVSIEIVEIKDDYVVEKIYSNFTNISAIFQILAKEMKI